VQPLGLKYVGAVNLQDRTPGRPDLQAVSKNDAEHSDTTPFLQRYSFVNELFQHPCDAQLRKIFADGGHPPLPFRLEVSIYEQEHPHSYWLSAVSRLSLDGRENVRLLRVAQGSAARRSPGDEEHRLLGEKKAHGSAGVPADPHVDETQISFNEYLVFDAENVPVSVHATGPQPWAWWPLAWRNPSRNSAEKEEE
jgi:hypothetical protein